MKMYIKIELRSDLCVSDGGVYNSALDVDVCHDELGFPYIPAKRIRGCLRECELELREWGMGTEGQEIFGEGGNQVSVFRIGNAYLENYVKMREEVLKNRNSVMTHPVNVLNHFSYIRTQTAINYERGVADDTSLRTMRVINKGLVFWAEVSAFIGAKSTELETLKTCCRILRHMGLSRTRGLGDVSVTLCDTIKESSEEQAGQTCVERMNATKSMAISEGANYIKYVIELDEPMICKSVDGGEARTLDYIDGGKIMGLILHRLKSSKSDEGEIKSFLEKCREIFCSNAYLTYKETIRMLEVPACFYEIKDNDSEYINKLFETDDEKKNTSNLQLSRMRHCYVTEDTEENKEKRSLVRKKVSLENRYHHKRPSDKSIGRALGQDESDSGMYQISSISAGQKFSGYIRGTTEQIALIDGLLRQSEECCLGFARTSEYGKARICVTGSGTSEPILYENVKEFSVKLEAPAIIYSENAMYSTDPKDLIAEVMAALGLEESKAGQIKKYLNYTTVGGYNVTWGKRKPTIEAFGAGTVLHFCMNEEVTFSAEKVLYLGERISEGFGEASLQGIDSNGGIYQGTIMKQNDGDSREKLIVTENSILLNPICKELFHSFVQIHAVQAAKEMKKGLQEQELNVLGATVSNMLLMCSENRNQISEVKKAVENRFSKKNSNLKNQKNEIAKKVLKIAEEANLSEQFAKAYDLNHDDNIGYLGNLMNDAERWSYLVEFLNELKYLLRENGGNDNE